MHALWPPGPSDGHDGGSPRRLNVAGAVLRSLGMILKFLLIYDLTRHLPLEDVGVYGLFTTSVVLGGSLLGLDFHTYSVREVVAADPPRRRRVVWNQLALHATAYAVFLPVLLLLAAAAVLPWRLTLFFCWITVGFHLCLEAGRLLIALRQPFVAYLVSFVANGLWVLLVLGVGLAAPEQRSLGLVFLCWGTGVSAAVLVAARALVRLQVLDRPVRPEPGFVANGLRTALVYYTGSLAGLAPRFADRYFIAFQLGDAALGAYTFLASIAGMLHDLVYAGFVSVVYPRALASHERGDLAAFRQLLRKLLSGGLLWSLALLPGFLGGIFVLLALVGRPELREALPAYYLLLASALVTTAAYRPHCELYAARRDRSLAGVAVLAATAAVAFNVLLVARFGLEGAATATLLATAGMASSKWILAWRQRQRGGSANVSRRHA